MLMQWYSGACLHRPLDDHHALAVHERAAMRAFHLFDR
jgi:hypothetical protein